MLDLFSSYQIKGLDLKNRVVMPPMCQYSVTKKDGVANDWHHTHYVSRAIGGTGLIIVEMTDVEPDGRISDYDLGLWSDEQIAPLAKIVDITTVQKSAFKLLMQDVKRRMRIHLLLRHLSLLMRDGRHHEN